MADDKGKNGFGGKTEGASTASKTGPGSGMPENPAESNLSSGARVENGPEFGADTPAGGGADLSGASVREHAEFRNCYTAKSVAEDIAFLKMVYGDKAVFSNMAASRSFIDTLNLLGKYVYFFIADLATDVTPQEYIKRKHKFIANRMPEGSPHMFFLAWNGLVKNDSFKRLLRKKFSLKPFNDLLCPKNIPAIGSAFTRYRTKLVLADDMATEPSGKRRKAGRVLDDGSGLTMREGIVWLPNGKAMPLFPQAYVPLNQTQVILVRHGKSEHESGGGNPEFVGAGHWDTWRDNRRVSGAIGNNLHQEGIETAKELGRDFRVIVDTLSDAGHALWPWSKEQPILVYGSESENTEQTARYFLSEAGYTNVLFRAAYGLNSQKYGALTHRFKKEAFEKVIGIYGASWKGDDQEKKDEAKALFKNRFFHFPEGETLIEADWRIAYSFVDLLRSNQGRRILLCDHSGAIRVFSAIIKTLDFADYCTLKEAQDSIMALTYQPGRNVRYDHLQKSAFPLRRD